MAGLILAANNSYCYEASDFSVAKSFIGVISNFNGDGVSIQRMVLAENVWGAKIWFGRESDDNNLSFKNIIFKAMARPNCYSCYTQTGSCNDFHAIYIPVVQIHGKSIPIDKKTPDGLLSICADSALDSKLAITNVTFFNYKIDYQLDANTNFNTCSNNYIFQQPGVPDSSSRIYLRNVTAKNSAKVAFFKFEEPDPAFLFWRGGCGDFLCTGNKNWILTDLDGTLFGAVSQVTPKNLGISSALCHDVPEWNGRLCDGKNFGMIEFQNDGPGQRMRLISPVNITSSIMKNTLNEWREWKWNGIDPADKRLARFNGMLQVNTTNAIEFEVVVPEELKLKLERFEDFWWVIINIRYERPNVIEVWNMANQTMIKPFKKEDNINLTALALSPDQCGANIYDVDNSSIIFVLNSQSDCILKVRTIDSIRITMHLETTVEDFYKNNAQATFFDKIRAFLGLDMARIRIAGIRSGSVILIFDIVEELNLTNSTSALDTENSTSDGNLTESEIQLLNSTASELKNYGEKLVQSIDNGSFTLPNTTILGITTQLISTNITSTNDANNTTNNTNNTNNNTNEGSDYSWVWNNDGKSNKTRNSTEKSQSEPEDTTKIIILLSILIPGFTILFLIVCCCLKNKEGITLIRLAFDYTKFSNDKEISYQEIDFRRKNVKMNYHIYFNLTIIGI